MFDVFERIRAHLTSRWPNLAGMVARASLATVFAWLGVMQFVWGADRMTPLLEAHRLLPSSAGGAGPVLAMAVGAVEVVGGEDP